MKEELQEHKEGTKEEILLESLTANLQKYQIGKTQFIIEYIQS